MAKEPDCPICFYCLTRNEAEQFHEDELELAELKQEKINPGPNAYLVFIEGALVGALAVSVFKK